MQSALVTNTDDDFDFQINRKYLFFWNESYIKYHPIDEGIDDESKFTTADFEMDADDQDSYIKELRTGSNPYIFVFVVVQQNGENTIYTWFTKENAEAEAYDVQGKWEILWDRLGNLFIVNGNKVIMNNQRCCVTTFDF